MPDITFEIPTPAGNKRFTVSPGSSLFFLGPNGGGKTRLSARIEEMLGLVAHRISAHRALSLNPEVAKVSEHLALNGLRTGHAVERENVGHRIGQRWHSNASVALLNDYNFLIQALFAEQNNKALETHKRNRTGDTSRADPTNFEKLINIWKRLLPHRDLEITGDNITVSITGRTPYAAKEMSDGERAIFYLIGQALCAQTNTVLIFDEPELHIHRAIMSKLWDELEAARPDCAFIVISHDLEFIASRIGSKFIIRDYINDQWTLDEVPEESGFTEEIATLILGSRKPILFVEGTGTSLDLGIYRACYPNWTVIPRGSCEEVIHSVVTMRANQSLTRVTCSGIVDADGYTAGEITYLGTLGIKVLPVSEIENTFLLPQVATAIGRHEGHEQPALEQKMNALLDGVIANIGHGTNLQSMVMRYCKRRIDRVLKKIDLGSAQTTAELSTEYSRNTSALDVTNLAAEIQRSIQTFIDGRNLPGLLQLYDNKGLVSIVAQQMKASRSADFESWLLRVLGNRSVPEITDAFKRVLPEIDPQ
jgi:ABC-type cobalamin/Fe3+-siderophores transport system ATPase subunit